MKNRQKPVIIRYSERKTGLPLSEQHKFVIVCAQGSDGQFKLLWVLQASRTNICVGTGRSAGWTTGTGTRMHGKYSWKLKFWC
jgi:hypothetical protein